VAVSVAHALVREFSGAVYFVDLASIQDPRLVGGAVVSALGLMVRTSDPVPTLLAFLEEKRILLVLDNCEHVIESVAVLAERIFTAAPRVYILATSRELLRVEGERVHKLPPQGVSIPFLPPPRRSRFRPCNCLWSVRPPVTIALN
jgi:predicted ATPase